MSRRNRFTMLEDTFADMTLEEQNKMLPILVGLNRQKTRNGAALADRTQKPPAVPRETPPPAQPGLPGCANEAIPLPAVCPHGYSEPAKCIECVKGSLPK